MQITTGPYDPDTRQVEATFVDAGRTHMRFVNACHTAAGYDAEATALRLADVAAGVKVKMDLGLFDQPPETGPVPKDL